MTLLPLDREQQEELLDLFRQIRDGACVQKGLIIGRVHRSRIHVDMHDARKSHLS